MNLRRRMNIENYLYEIMDDYKNADSEKEKDTLLNLFFTSIWTSNNKRRVYNKLIRFTIDKDLLETDIGQVFDTWSEIEYKGYKSMSKETDWCSLIRQKINNLYTIHFDKEAVLKQDYINLLSTPKRYYYQWIDGMEMNPNELTTIIDDALDAANKLKATYQNQKMEISWNEYKKIIEGFIVKIFNSSILIEDYEDKTKLNNIYDFVNEDNFYISYFCKSLELYLLNYTKEYYGLKRGRNKSYKRCTVCGALIQIESKKDFSTKYCKLCSNNVVKEQTRLRVQKFRNSKCNGS